MKASSDAPPKVLLLDLDNCPKFLTGLKELEEFERIVACHGPVEPKLPLSTVLRLATPIHVGQVEFVKMVKGGQDAADFGLAFMAGKLAAELPEDAEFYLVSGDKALDHVVYLLQEHGRTARRIDESQPPRLTPLSVSEVVVLAEQFMKKLSHVGNAPRRITTLAGSVSAFLGKDPRVSATAVIATLQRLRFVAVQENGRVLYRHLKEFTVETEPAKEHDGEDVKQEIETATESPGRV